MRAIFALFAIIGMTNAQQTPLTEIVTKASMEASSQDRGADRKKRAERDGGAGRKTRAEREAFVKERQSKRDEFISEKFDICRSENSTAPDDHLSLDELKSCSIPKRMLKVLEENWEKLATPTADSGELLLDTTTFAEKVKTIGR